MKKAQAGEGRKWADRKPLSVPGTRRLLSGRTLLLGNLPSWKGRQQQQNEYRAPLHLVDFAYVEKAPTTSFPLPAPFYEDVILPTAVHAYEAVYKAATHWARIPFARRLQHVLK